MVGMAEHIIESNCSYSVKTHYYLETLSKMAKNLTIDSDLQKVLHDVVHNLQDSNNFAEIAILLQTSVDIYGKKVDMLWDTLFAFQKRMIVYDKRKDKSQEMEELEDRKRKYKRKRLTKTNDEASVLVNSFCSKKVEFCDYLNRDFEKHDLIEVWQEAASLHITNAIAAPTEVRNNGLFLPDNAITTEDHDYIGKYNQFHSVSLLEEIFHLEDNNLLQDELSCLTRLRIDAYVINDFLKKHSITTKEPINNYIDDLKRYIDNYIRARKQGNKDSETCLQDLRRSSMADSLFDQGFDDENFCSVSECTQIRNTPFENIDKDSLIGDTGKIQERNKSCSQDSAFCDDDDCHFGLDTPAPIIPSILQEPEVPSTSTIAPEAPTAATESAPISLGSAIIIPKPMKIKEPQERKRKPIEEKIAPEIPKKRPRKLSSKMLLKLSTGITANLADFESFCRSQYKPAEDEGEMPSVEALDQSDDDDDDFGGADYLITSTPIRARSRRLEDSAFNEMSQPQEGELCKSATRSNVAELDFAEAETIRRSVNDWRSFIQPKLRSMDQKADFDIHEYESRIVDPVEIGEKRNFKNIVANQSAAEITRYLMASLQLANMRNIEFSGVLPGQLSNETLELTVVDKTRHYELLEDSTLTEDHFKAGCSGMGSHIQSTPKEKSSNPRKRHFH